MVNIGVVGCGYWGPNLLRNFHELDGVRVVGCADLQKERLEVIKKKYPFLEVTRDFRDIVSSPSIDAVAIATPISTHYALAREALLNGKSVLIEKPMTASFREGEELIALAEKKNKILMVDHTFVYTSAVRKIKEIIDRGELGKVFYCDSVRVNLGLFQHDVNVIWDLAPHDLSILDFLLGKMPVEVSAVGACHVGNQIENIAYLHLNFDAQLTAHIHVNWLAPVKIRMMLIGGSKKMVVYNDMEPSEKVKIYDKGVTFISDEKEIYNALVGYRRGDMYAPNLEQVEALHNLCSHFVDCIKSGEKPITDGEAGLRVVKVLEACQKSLENKGKMEEIK
ncbi:MAG: Gfo/Idh/MocA family oxidoreductase [Caldiserica bacterium]|nr:Gfo/Idh/MocA family oxidoreductase [Caldisericota bacterium]